MLFRSLVFNDVSDQSLTFEHTHRIILIKRRFVQLHVRITRIEVRKLINALRSLSFRLRNQGSAALEAVTKHKALITIKIQDHCQRQHSTSTVAS